jgi:hypothetical protein
MFIKLTVLCCSRMCIPAEVINWGYAVCDAAMRKFVVSNAGLPLGWPYPEYRLDQPLALKLMYAAVIRAADRWRGLTVGEFEQRQLRVIREELDRAHAERVRPVVRPSPSASAVRLSNKART